MINVLVTYRVKPEFVAENKRNIENFLKDFQELDNTKFVYNVFLKEDGVTFVHSSSYYDEQIQQQVLTKPSFVDFQNKRDQSGLENSHTVALLQLIGSTQPIFY